MTTGFFLSKQQCGFDHVYALSSLAVAEKPITERLEALQILIPKLSQADLRRLACNPSVCDLNQAQPMVSFGCLESLFKHWTGRACDLVQFKHAEKALEMFFLGQDLQTLISYALLEKENDKVSASQFCRLALRIAINKFGIDAIKIAAMDHPDGARIHGHLLAKA